MPPMATTRVNLGHHVTLTSSQIFKLAFQGYQISDICRRTDEKHDGAKIVFFPSFVG